MAIYRPLSKDMIKKMFLKVLSASNELVKSYVFESEYSTNLSNAATSFFEIDDFNEEEYLDANQALHELEEEGYIESEHSEDGSLTKVLTEKGKEFGKELIKLQLPENHIFDVVTRFDLREEVMYDFLSGDYEVAINKAFNFIEMKMKEKSVVAPQGFKPEQISLYFVTNEGKLKKKDTDTDRDLDSLRRIMLGTMIWYRDSIKDNNFMNNAEAAAQVLVFANMQLNLIEK